MDEPTEPGNTVLAVQVAVRATAMTADPTDPYDPGNPNVVVPLRLGRLAVGAVNVDEHDGDRAAYMRDCGEVWRRWRETIIAELDNPDLAETMINVIAQLGDLDPAGDPKGKTDGR